MSCCRPRNGNPSKVRTEGSVSDQSRLEQADLAGLDACARVRSWSDALSDSLDEPRPHRWITKHLLLSELWHPRHPGLIMEQSDETFKAQDMQVCRTVNRAFKTATDAHAVSAISFCSKPVLDNKVRLKAQHHSFQMEITHLIAERRAKYQKCFEFGVRDRQQSAGIARVIAAWVVRCTNLVRMDTPATTLLHLEREYAQSPYTLPKLRSLSCRDVPFDKTVATFL